MPRPNPTRELGIERDLAERIRYERTRTDRDWSYEKTAIKLRSVGCAIQASAIYKIERGDPPRRISVVELAAFAEIFGLSVEELLLPVEFVVNREMIEVVTEIANKVNAVQNLAYEILDWWARYHRLAQDNPELAAKVEEVYSLEPFAPGDTESGYDDGLIAIAYKFAGHIRKLAEEAS